MTREDLKNYKYKKDWIQSQINKYIEQREQIMGLSQYFDGMPKAQNKPNYELEELVDKYNELINIMNKEQSELNDIIKQLNKLKPIYKLILYKRYIEGKSLEEVSTEIGYSYNKTCTFNGDALDEFDKIG